MLAIYAAGGGAASKNREQARSHKERTSANRGNPVHGRDCSRQSSGIFTVPGGRKYYFRRDNALIDEARLTDGVTLREVHAEFSQHTQDLVRLDALGNRAFGHQAGHVVN